MDYVDVAVELLRRLTGRVTDPTLAALWRCLGARQRVPMLDTLFGTLRDDRIVLRPAELVLLRRLLDDPDDPRLAQVTIGVVDVPQYEFVSDAPAPAPSDVDVVRWADCAPEAVRVLRSWRRPAEESALAAPAWVYVVEVVRGTDVSRVQRTLDIVGLQVVVAGEHLPGYQADALAAGQVIWPIVRRYRASY